MNVAAVSALTGVAATEVKTIHERAALLQPHPSREHPDEATRLKKEHDDTRTAAEKARIANKKVFRP